MTLPARLGPAPSGVPVGTRRSDAAGLGGAPAGTVKHSDWTRREWLLALGTGLLSTGLLGGCASWQQDAAETEAQLGRVAGLPEARVADDVALIEAVVVPIGLRGELSGDTAQMPWESMDTTVLSPELRQRLATNGLQAGRASGVDLDGLLETEAIDETLRLLREANVLSDFEHKRHQFSCREGKTHLLSVRRQHPGELATLIRSADRGVVGRTLERPQFMLQVKTVLLDDGRMMVRLIPDIQHGQVQPNYVANEGLAFRVDYARPAWTLEELTMDVPLAPGQAIVVVPADPPFGLGEQMLVGRRADQTQQRVAVLVQLKRLPAL